MGELALEYGDQIFFNVVSAEETEKRTDEIASYGFTEQRHGLVGFASDGTVRATIPGHQFGEPEIREVIETLLADS